MCQHFLFKTEWCLFFFCVCVPLSVDTWFANLHYNYCEEYCHDTSLKLHFHFFWLYAWNLNCWIMWWFYFRYFEKTNNTVLHSGCNILRCPQKCTRLPLSPHPLQPLLCSGCCWFGFVLFLLVDILMSMKW